MVIRWSTFFLGRMCFSRISRKQICVQPHDICPFEFKMSSGTYIIQNQLNLDTYRVLLGFRTSREFWNRMNNCYVVDSSIREEKKTNCNRVIFGCAWWAYRYVLFLAWYTFFFINFYIIVHWRTTWSWLITTTSFFMASNVWKSEWHTHFLGDKRVWIIL